MITAQDATRRDTIADYRVIGLAPEPDLEGLVQLAATVCDVPTAVINIIDDRFQHQIAAVGFTAAVCAREDSMCAQVFQDPGHVVVPDAREDERFARNPFVTGAVASVRFYASSPLVTPSGIAIGTLCVFDEEAGDLDETRSRALALLAHQVVDVLELRRLTRELGESNRRLEHFARQVSHDLTAPLTALTAYIDLASVSPELERAPRAADALARAESAALRMSTMISDLLDYARLGGSTPRRDEVDLADVVRGVLDDLHPLIDGARVVVDADVRVVGDATLLGVLVQNLVANALKFTRATGAVPRIEIRAMRLAGAWRISVDDNGPGVASDERERVFELMARSGSGEVPGLGIGLTTCRRIAEAHHARIGIGESPLGGASVWVVLPRDVGDAGAVRERESRAATVTA
ncbi:sensor histidine kinase [Microbacterium sp. SSM24]|uniref:sensor histidine kinase n=1 Tax=Microbacterium sp. SSM24 TaxID=2991714 RepID=UPI0022260C4A|nr:GAF domain-containing sensor histidine kinase [Microbacterium sp. SSM24]MCW3493117.1 GAF domain-containing sensor histidine kinase [Microbacterium sp. SSM24]